MPICDILFAMKKPEEIKIVGLTGKVVFALCAAMAAFGAHEARGAAIQPMFAAATALQSSDGTNPIVKDRFSPDPAPVVDGDTLYVFTGHDDLGRFAFSEDGVAWFPLGRSFKMRYTIPHFTGYRFASTGLNSGFLDPAGGVISQAPVASSTFQFLA